MGRQQQALASTLLGIDPELREDFVRERLGDLPFVERVLHEVTGRAALLPHQVPPEGQWTYWLLIAGRGGGKSFAGSTWLNDHMTGPPCDPRVPGGHRAAIIAPTHGDAADSCVTGPSGVKTINPDVRLLSRQGGTVAVWPTGAQARLFGAYTPEDVERLRAGGNNCACWAEELAAWRQLQPCWDHMEFGRRLGPDPRVVVTTTPKPRPLLHRLIADVRTVVSRATTDDNPHLVGHVRAALFERYGGTHLGRQELLGELVREAEGALWRWAWIDDNRVPTAPSLQRVVIGVDPSGSDSDGADEQGIIAAGRGVDGHLYGLGDRSCKLTPDGWGRRVVQAWLDFRADACAVERNYGGQMAMHVIKTAARDMKVEGLRIIEVNATRGKAVRAEPISALYEQGRAHHVEQMPELEDQLTGWEPDAGWSPDRLDALVWAGTELMMKGGGPSSMAKPQGKLMPAARPGRSLAPARLGRA